MNRYYASDADNQRQEQAGTDVHDTATFIDSTKYSLDLPKVASLFLKAGIHRTARSLQRYCDNGSIDARKYNTERGSVWLANPESVELKIKEILELAEAARLMSSTVDDTTTNEDMSSPQVGDIPGDTEHTKIDDDQRQSFADAGSRPFDKATNELQTPDRQSTTGDDGNYMSVPVGVIDALTEQLAEKDRQIERRDMELQRMGKERDQDRAMLSQALYLIHGDSFTPPLSSGKETVVPEPVPLSEIPPEPLNQHQKREGGNPQADWNGHGV